MADRDGPAQAGLDDPAGECLPAGAEPGLLDATVPSGYGADLTAQYRAFRFGVVPAGRGVSRLRGAYGTSLSLLFGLTGLVLLITCANLATLTLARASAREREIAVRVAIGASRTRVLSLMLIESLLVAVGGAALAVPVALLSGRALIAFLDTSANPVALNLAADWRLIAFVGASAALTSMLFGLVPALRVSFVDPIAAMRQSSRGSDGRSPPGPISTWAGGRADRGVAGPDRLGACSSSGAFDNLTLVDAGFEQEGTVAVWALDRQAAGLSIEQRVAFQQRLIDEIGSVPGVAAAAAATHIPLSGDSWWHFFRVTSLRRRRTPGVAIHLRQSRLLRDAADPDPCPAATFRRPTTPARRRVMLVNESFVRSHLGGLSPIGATLRTVAEAGYPETTYEIIGVVGNTKYADLREEMPPIAFVPIAQNPDLQPWAPVIVRASTPVSGITARDRAAGEGVESRARGPVHRS